MCPSCKGTADEPSPVDTTARANSPAPRPQCAESVASRVSVISVRSSARRAQVERDRMARAQTEELKRKQENAELVSSTRKSAVRKIYHGLQKRTDLDVQRNAPTRQLALGHRSRSNRDMTYPSRGNVHPGARLEILVGRLIERARDVAELVSATAHLFEYGGGADELFTQPARKRARAADAADVEQADLPDSFRAIGLDSAARLLEHKETAFVLERSECSDRTWGDDGSGGDRRRPDRRLTQQRTVVLAFMWEKVSTRR